MRMVDVVALIMSLNAFMLGVVSLQLVALLEAAAPTAITAAVCLNQAASKKGSGCAHHRASPTDLPW